MTQSSAIRISGLAFRYSDGTAALRGVNLTVEAGERVALVGPNGAGKSTLVAQIVGLLTPDSGEVQIMGIPAGKSARKSARNQIRQKVGLVFQNPDDQLFLGTVFDDVAFGPLNQMLPEEEVRVRVERALSAVGAEGLEKRFPGHLSVGQKRSVALATVLAMRPEILILDEPASNLDPYARRKLIEQLNALGTGATEHARTMLLVTHDLEMVLDCCPRTIVLSEGRVVADGPSVEILGNPHLMETHRLEVPYSLRRDHVHRFPLRGTVHEKEHRLPQEMESE